MRTTDGWTIQRDEESSHDPVRVQNACGFVAVEGVQMPHAWRKARTVLGVVQVAYTTGGNLLVSNSMRITFKGATNVAALRAALGRLTVEPSAPVLQLVVLSVGIGRCLHVHVGCLLETRLGRLPWVSVMNRIEEVCNIVVFYVLDWGALGVEWATPPKTATATLTRRGTLTLRLVWEGIEWEDNEAFKGAIGRLRDFIRELVL
jgi:hypothetical protein